MGWEWHRHVEVKGQLWRVNFLLVHVAPQDQSQVVRLSDKPLTNLPPPGTVTVLILTFLEYTKF